MGENFLQQIDRDQERNYRVSHFWVRNRKKMGAGLLMGIATIEALLCVYGGSVIFDLFVVSRTEERSWVADVVHQPEILKPADQAVPFPAPDVSVLPGTEGSVDFVAFLENKNTDWVFDGRARFVWEEGETPWVDVLVLPNAKTPVVTARVPVGRVPRKARMEFDIESGFRRLDRAQVGSDSDDWIADRTSIEVIEPVLTTIDVEGKARAHLSFSMHNQTAFSLQRPAFVAVLFRGSVVTGVYPFTLEMFEEGKKQEVALTWPGTPPAATSSRIFPLIDPFQL